MDLWLNRLCAGFPSKIEPGMTFRNCTSKKLLAITGGPKQANNPGLTGDAATWFDGQLDGGGKLLPSLAGLSPKKGWKFVKV